MRTVYLALGSNVGNGPVLIKQAIKLLGTSVDEIICAPLYTSKAVGFTAQADFTNTAISGKTSLSPEELLRFVKSVEQQVGRIARFRWGPREIDIDIIFYDNVIVNLPDLKIPHVQFAERDFVLRPLNDIASSFVDPRSGQTIQYLLQNLAHEKRAVLQQIDSL